MTDITGRGDKERDKVHESIVERDFRRLMTTRALRARAKWARFEQRMIWIGDSFFCLQYRIKARLGLLPRCSECGDLIDYGTVCEACWSYWSHQWPY